MNNLLVVEQLQLHFGEEYANVTIQVRKFCTTIVKKPWWGQNCKILLNNEGGMSGMRLQALMLVAEKEDIGVGLKAYGRYLRQEYGSQRTTLVSLNEESVAFHDLESKKIPLDEEDLNIEGFGIERRDEPESFEDSDSQSLNDLQSQYALVQVLEGLSEPEHALFSAYASTKDLKESSALCGMSYLEGKKVWRRVHTRAMYAVDIGKER